MNNSILDSQTKDAFSYRGLPYEIGSPSELLSSTQIFAVEIISVESSVWALGEDKLEHRQLKMKLKLLESFKGILEPTDDFHLEVEQHREDKFLGGDQFGLWSQMQLSEGDKYLVLAESSSKSPINLMQEEFCKRLAELEREKEVQLAIEAEQKFQSTIRLKDFENPRLTAALKMIKIPPDLLPEAKGMFARYLWVRVGPIFAKHWEVLFPEVVELIENENSHLELKESLVYDLYVATMFFPNNPELFRKLIKFYFALLLEGEFAELHYSLADLYLHNLIFKEGNGLADSKEILPEEEDRERLKKVVGEFKTNRAQKVLKWLSSS